MALFQVVRTTIAEPLELSTTEIFDFMAKVADPSLRTESMQQIGWLFDLLEGPLDADRWDYLWRDTLHLGFLEYHEQVRSGLSAFLDSVTVHYDGARSYLQIDRDVTTLLARNFFYVRKHLYNSIYEHPGKQLIDASLNRAVYWRLLRDFNLPSIEKWYSREYSTRVTDFAHLTDSSLLEILELHDEGASSAVCSLFVRELLVYPTFSVGFELRFNSAEAERLLAATRAVVEETDPIRKSQDRPRLPQSLVVDNAEQTREILHSRRRQLVEQRVIRADAPPVMELILHSHLIAYNPAACLQFDRLLWRRLRERTDVGLFVREVIESTVVGRVEALREGLESKAVSEAILAFPPVFAAFPWIPVPDMFGIQGLKRTPFEERFAVREPNGVISISDPGGLVPSSETGDSIVFAVGFPLFAVRTLTETQLAHFRLALGEVTRELLCSGFCLAVREDLRGQEYDEPLLNAL